MARLVRDSRLETRTARARLKARHKPYFRTIERGLHIGYRKPVSGPGTWVVRRYIGNDRYSVENLRTDNHLVLADDYSEPDNKVVLSFGQAQVRAKQSRPGRGPYSVNDALNDYFKLLHGEGRSAHSIRDAECRADSLIRPQLGNTKVDVLTTDKLRQWRDGVASSAPRLRTREGEEQKFRKTGDQRARRATANRTWTILRAALNHAFNDGKVESDVAWRKVKPFKKVDAARVGYLTVAEAKRLINACDSDFRLLVHGALATGARYGELCALTVGDFNADVGTIAIAQSKSGKARHIVLTDEGRAFFRELTAGRAKGEPMFRKEWNKSEQFRPMNAACEAAKLKRISFHALRHTWASLAVMGCVPLMVVARNLGHTDTRMVEKYYGHLAPSFVADAIRKGAPTFGFKPNKKIAAI